MVPLPYKMPDWPTYCESVDKGVSAENFTSVAGTTSDAQVLLGLAFLAKAGSPVRPEIAKMAVTARPEYAPIAAILAITMDGIDDESVGELIQRDPDNALGYYLRGTLLHESDRENEALEAFRKAAACTELRLYESTTGEALFKALDALNLHGRDRLCALGWMASRASQFSSVGIQAVRNALPELARSVDREKREEISDLLLILAGHLFATNFVNRHFAESILASAFGLKAEAAAGTPTKMNGYAAAVQTLANAFSGWPGIDDRIKMRNVVQSLPSRIHRAFAMADASKRKMLGEMNVSPPESDRAAFEKATENAVKTAETLIAVALTDPDGIIGAYLKGLPPGQSSADRSWVFQSTFVERLMQERPDVFKAAAAHEDATMALWKAGENDPWYRNQRRMAEIGLGLHSYAHEHDNTYPDSIAVLFEKGYLKPPLEARSLVTGKPFVYVAAGEKPPVKSSDRFKFVVFYDDHSQERGYLQCVFASCVGGSVRTDDLKAQLRKRGKS